MSGWDALFTGGPAPVSRQPRTIRADGVDLYVLVGLAAPVLLVHKGQICLNAGADKGNPLLLQLRWRCSRCASDMTVGMPDSSTRLAWIRLRWESACHDIRMIKKDARRYFASITVMAGRKCDQGFCPVRPKISSDLEPRVSIGNQALRPWRLDIYVIIDTSIVLPGAIVFAVESANG